MTDKKLKIEFAPGCFDHLDIDQAELDEIVEMLENMTEEELEANSHELTEEDFKEMDDDIREQLLNALNNEPRQLQ